MSFKAEELTSKIFPESGVGIWAACPQDTLGKGHPCGDTKRPCPQDTKPIGPACFAASGQPKPPRDAAGLDRDALVLLRTQLRDRMAQGPAAGL